MKVKVIIIGIFLLIVILTSFSVCFFHQHEIPYIEYHAVDKSDFWPMAFRIFHDESSMQSYINLYEKGGAMEQKISEIQLDFEKYSYILVYGAKIDRMYYSMKSTWFDDISPYYASARRYNECRLFIDYLNPDGCVYLYQIKKNVKLRGICGC